MLKISNPNLNLTLQPHELGELELAAEGGPVLYGDWRNLLLIHYAVAPDVLQPYVPFPLDHFDGQAIVTLAAYRMENMRLAWKGAPPWLLRPGDSDFLNVRTYARVGGERGIVFLRQYEPNRLARLVGPATYGLPFRLAGVEYAHDARNRRFVGRVARGQQATTFEADYALAPDAVEVGGFEEFVLERYTAFTRWMGRDRQLRVAHPAWCVRRARLLHWKDDFLRAEHPFWPRLRYLGAHFTSGFRDVAMGAPQRIHANFDRPESLTFINVKKG